MNIDTSLLALDTSFGEISAALHTASGDFHAATPDSHGKTRSVAIVPLLEQLLQEAEVAWDQIEVLALGAGPGSFTGLRIAAATLAGLNSGLNLPIVHLSSLAITARQADCGGPLRVLEDARAGEAFTGYYQAGKALAEDRCMLWDEVVADYAPALFACHSEPPVSLEGWRRCPLTISRSQALLAAAVEGLAQANLSLLSRYPNPVYLQRSQAEKNLDVR